MTDKTVWRVADLPQNAPTSFAVRPDADTLRQIQDQLGLLGLRKLSFAGKITASGKKDWEIRADLGATVVQPCVVTLEPVTTRLDTLVRRILLAEWDAPEEAEVEMAEDDEADQLGTEIDVFAMMVEALALSLPEYPRADGAELGQLNVTEPGKAALTDEDVKPFAGLADLRDRLKKEE
ncbi:YceD family protein [Falsiruegeria mediterranea]